MSSLIPERPLLVYPSIAATIGLEEAALLSLLDELTQYDNGHERQGYRWHELNHHTLKRTMAFWRPDDIQRLSQRLRDLGIILLTSAPYSESQILKFAFNRQALDKLSTPLGNTRHQAPAASNRPAYQRTYSQHTLDATPIAANWQPNQDTLLTLGQHNIPEPFIREQVPDFVHYWRERGERQKTWGSKFIQHIKHQWTHYVAKNSGSSHLPKDWQPSQELQQQIANEGIPATFVDKSLQRFVMYHKTSNTKNTNWDMPFFSWLKEDWEKQDTPFIDKKRTLIPENWTPDKHTVDYLQHSQGIEITFINECIHEFIHKWLEKKAFYSEWGNLFAKHVIELWRFHQNGIEQNPTPKLIGENWQPSLSCLEVLEHKSGIPRRFIGEQLPEFILYWSNRGEAKHSWDSIFLRHIKHQWSQHHERGQANIGAVSSRDVSLEERLTDRSWAK